MFSKNWAIYVKEYHAFSDTPSREEGSFMVTMVNVKQICFLSYVNACGIVLSTWKYIIQDNITNK